MCVIQWNHVVANLKRFWVGLDIKLNMIICLNNFPHQIFSKFKIAKNMEKFRNIIYVNNYQCLIINKDTLMNQQSK